MQPSADIVDVSTGYLFANITQKSFGFVRKDWQTMPLIRAMIKRIIAILTKKRIGFWFVILIGLNFELLVGLVYFVSFTKRLNDIGESRARDVYRELLFEYKHNLHWVARKESQAQAAERAKNLRKMEESFGFKDEELGWRSQYHL